MNVSQNRSWVKYFFIWTLHAVLPQRYAITEANNFAKRKKKTLTDNFPKLNYYYYY